MREDTKTNVPSFGAILGKRIILITGKGGVGRSTITAAAAKAAAAEGKRVLLAEISDASGDAESSESPRRDYSPLARLFGRDHLPQEKEQLAPGIWGTQLVPLKGHELFLESVFRVGTLVRAALQSEALRKLFQAAPSIREIGIFYCLIELLREPRPNGGFANELIFVDMPATGHALALTGLPQILLSMVPSGPIANALREGQAYLSDPDQAAAYIVTIPETLPVSETLELIDGFRASKLHVGGVLLNRLPQDLFTPEERTVLARFLDGARLGDRASASHALVLGEERFESFAEARRETERLISCVDVPVFRLSEAPVGSASIVDHLSAELREFSA